MDIREALSAVCAAILVSEMLLMLTPSGNLKKFARLAIGIMTAAMLLAPLKGCSLPALEPSRESYSAQTDYARRIWDVYQREAENINDRE